MVRPDADDMLALRQSSIDDRFGEKVSALAPPLSYC